MYSSVLCPLREYPSFACWMDFINDDGYYRKIQHQEEPSRAYKHVIMAHVIEPWPVVHEVFSSSLS